MYKFDVIPVFPYVITSVATLVTLPSFSISITCKASKKIKAFNSSQAKIKQTAQTQSLKSKSNANITKWVLISEKLKSFVYKPFVMFKELICIQRRRSEQENSQVESKEQNCNNLGKFQGRGALGRGRSA